MNPLIFPAVSYGCLKFPMVGPLVGCTFHFWLHVVSKLRRKMYTRSMTRSPIIGITRPSSKRRVFFWGGGMGWGAQDWSMINVTLATPVPALGSLCFNDSSKSWCGGVESILRNLWDVDRGDRLDAIGLWKIEGSEIGLPCVWSMVSRVSDTELHPAVRIGFLEFLTPAAQLKRISSQSCFFLPWNHSWHKFVISTSSFLSKRTQLWKHLFKQINNSAPPLAFDRFSISLQPLNDLLYSSGSKVAK